jgi:hypothetical protein
MNILNGREQGPSLDKEGYTLSPNVPTTVQDFANVPEVEETYLPEVERTVRAAFTSNGGVHLEAVVPFHWLVRDARRDNYDSSKGPSTFRGTAHAPVARVHGDYTVENGPLRFAELQARGLLPAEWDPATAHWGIVNVWRSVGDVPVATKPLAVLDVTSVQAEDVFQYWLVAGGSSGGDPRIGRNLAVSHNPGHRWMYFPQMTNQEALLFFTFEHLGAKPASDKAVPRTVFHTAFDPQDETS